MSKPQTLSVKVLIRDGQGRYLLIKRSASSKANAEKWDFPGGKVDPGEDFKEALTREVAEETGLTISLGREIAKIKTELTDKIITYVMMEGRVESGKVQLSSEHDEFAWVKDTEICSMNLVEQFRIFAQGLGNKIK